MHREIQDHIENVLAGAALEHLSQCAECRGEVEGMQEHAALLRELRAPEGLAAEPRAGFYARVMERIEAEGPISIWNLFIESAFGQRIAVASMALALLVGVYLVTSERSADDPMIARQELQQVVVAGEGQPAAVMVAGEDGPARVITQMDQFSGVQSSQDAVLADLVTYREQ
jgi:anti-sigma factor RsiW